MIQLGKETRDNIAVQGMFNADIKAMEDGFNVNGKVVKVEVHNMYDRKASDTYLGCTGAYCDLCIHSKSDCIERVKSAQFFMINRDLETMNSIFDTLVTEDGEISKRKDDYSTRQGQIDKPIPEHDNAVTTMQVLHGLLRSFDHLMKMVVHVVAGVFSWSEDKASRSHVFLKKRKERLQAHIFDKLSEKWDQPDSSGKGGTTTQGNAVRNILHKNFQTVVDFVDDDKYKEFFSKYASDLSIILRIISCKEKVNVQRFQKFCNNTYTYLLTNMPWVSVTPTVHKVLGHSWELIELNSSYGLGALDESGMEGCHKVLRNYRINLSRKQSQQANMTDTIHRLWLTSDPAINKERQKGLPLCKKCFVRGHSGRYCGQLRQNLSSTDLFNSLLDI